MNAAGILIVLIVNVSLRETLLTVIFPLQVIVWFLQACLLQRTAC